MGSSKNRRHRPFSKWLNMVNPIIAWHVGWFDYRTELPRRLSAVSGAPREAVMRIWNALRWGRFGYRTKPFRTGGAFLLQLAISRRCTSNLSVGISTLAQFGQPSGTYAVPQLGSVFIRWVSRLAKSAHEGSSTLFKHPHVGISGLSSRPSIQAPSSARLRYSLLVRRREKRISPSSNVGWVSTASRSDV